MKKISNLQRNLGARIDWAKQADEIKIDLLTRLSNLTSIRNERREEFITDLRNLFKKYETKTMVQNTRSNTFNNVG